MTAAEKRRKRLKVGIDDFVAYAIEAVDFDYAFLGEIDFAVRELEQVWGAVQRFWEVYSKTYGRGTYFWWAELQDDGQIHYHFILLNPPWRLEREWRQFYRRANPLGRHQPKPLWRTRDWVARNGGTYVKKYANKMAGPYARKARQQLYEFLPSWFRTFSSSQIPFIVADIRAHRDRYDGAAEFDLHPTQGPLVRWYCDQLLRHQRSPAGCSWQWRPRRRSRPPPGRSAEGR